MIDQGAGNAQLKGLRTPAGIQVEIVAEQPLVVNPIGLTFDNDGVPHVLQWTHTADEPVIVEFQQELPGGQIITLRRARKEVQDSVSRLEDEDGDGIYDKSAVLMDNLDLPRTLLIEDGEFYLTSAGGVLRRVKAEEGWMTNEIVRGLGGVGVNQASGLTLSPDGWLFVTVGEGDHHARGTDGSRADVLRSGAIFRCRPDGSELQEFARGFKNPCGAAAFDELGNLLLLDDDLSAGGSFFGVRLLHAQEDADYGWRLAASADAGQVDERRAAAWGDKPGKMPGIAKTGAGAPAGLLVYQGNAFPPFFRGLLIYPDAERRSVRAYRLEPENGTLRVAEQFTLMEWTDDALFRPCQAVQGPDGAIYVVDFRSPETWEKKLCGDGEHGRIYRLSWSGTADAPAIPRRPLDSWAKLAEQADDELLDRLDGADGAIRRKALELLVQRGADEGGRQRNLIRDRLRDIALNPRFRAAARVAAIQGAAHFYDAEVQDTLLELLDTDGDADIRRIAAETFGRCETKDTMTPYIVEILGDYVRDDPSPAVRRAAALAMGRTCHLAEDGPSYATIYLWNALIDEHATPSGDAFHRDGLLRALERMGAEGVQRLRFNVLKNPDSPPPRDFAIDLLQRTRTRLAAAALAEIFVEDLGHLTSEQVVRLIETYRNFQLDPPINANAVAFYLLGHKDASLAVHVAGLETLGDVAGGKPEHILELAQSLVSRIKSEASPPELLARAVAALDLHAANDSSGKLESLADELRGGSGPLAPQP